MAVYRVNRKTASEFPVNGKNTGKLLENNSEFKLDGREPVAIAHFWA